MSTLLDITTDPEIHAELSNKLRECYPGCAIVQSDTINQALKQIEQQDVDAIFIDARIASQLRQDINTLLANTPLTTKIILIDAWEGLINPEPYKMLGLKTINLPFSGEAIHKAVG